MVENTATKEVLKAPMDETVSYSRCYFCCENLQYDINYRWSLLLEEPGLLACQSPSETFRMEKAKQQEPSLVKLFKTLKTPFAEYEMSSPIYHDYVVHVSEAGIFRWRYYSAPR